MQLKLSTKSLEVSAFTCCTRLYIMKSHCNYKWEWLGSTHFFLTCNYYRVYHLFITRPGESQYYSNARNDELPAECTGLTGVNQKLIKLGASLSAGELYLSCCKQTKFLLFINGSKSLTLILIRRQRGIRPPRALLLSKRLLWCQARKESVQSVSRTAVLLPSNLFVRLWRKRAISSTNTQACALPRACLIPIDMGLKWALKTFSGSIYPIILFSCFPSKIPGCRCQSTLSKRGKTTPWGAAWEGPQPGQG